MSKNYRNWFTCKVATGRLSAIANCRCKIGNTVGWRGKSKLLPGHFQTTATATTASTDRCGRARAIVARTTVSTKSGEPDREQRDTKKSKKKKVKARCAAAAAAATTGDGRRRQRRPSATAKRSTLARVRRYAAVVRGDGRTVLNLSRGDEIRTINNKRNRIKLTF